MASRQEGPFGASQRDSADITRMAQALNDSLAQTLGDEALVVPTAVEQLRLIQHLLLQTITLRLQLQQLY